MKRARAERQIEVTESVLDHIDFLAFTIAFAPSDEVVDAVEAQLSKWWKWGIEDCDNTEGVAPLQWPKEYNPRSIKVALFKLSSSPPAILVESNLTDGYLSLSHMLSRSLPDAMFLIIHSKPVGRDEWPIEEFGMRKEADGGYVRHVWAALDTSGWKFGNQGEIQAFEEPEFYKKRAIKDRLTRAQIVRYLARLGVDLESLGNPENYKLLRCLAQVSPR